MYYNVKNKTLNIILFEMGIFLLPYDAMKVMPSTYAPLSIYFFLASFLVTLISKRGIGRAHV